MSWTKNEKLNFAKYLAVIGKYYEKIVDTEIAQMVVNDLQNYNCLECLNALEVYRQNPKNRTWPRAHDLIKILNPKLESSDQAKLAASRIVEAVTRFGNYNGQEAREFIGELGWRGVMSYGGWMYICANLGKDFDVGIFTAQMRDLANANINANETGHLDKPIGLDVPKNNILSLTQKLIETKKMPL